MASTINHYAVAYDSPLTLNVAYKLHINLQGTPEPGQQIFYNIIDKDNKIIMQNTLVNNNTIDYVLNYNIDSITTNTSKQPEINYLFTVYSLKAYIGNNSLSMAVPIQITMSANGISATPTHSYDGIGYSLDYYTVYGNFLNTTLVNKNFGTTASDAPSKIWGEVINNGEANAGYIEADGAIHLRNEINVVVNLPYVTKFISVQKSLEPTQYNKNYYFQ
jgi:hypothetical protein